MVMSSKYYTLKLTVKGRKGGQKTDMKEAD